MRWFGMHVFVVVWLVSQLTLAVASGQHQETRAPNLAQISDDGTKNAVPTTHDNSSIGVFEKKSQCIHGMRVHGGGGQHHHTVHKCCDFTCQVASMISGDEVFSTLIAAEPNRTVRESIRCWADDLITPPPTAST